VTLPRTYTIGQRTRLELHDADAFLVPADAMVFGRCTVVRNRAEAMAGRPFEPATTLTDVGWPCAQLTSLDLPWHHAVSIDYRPRSRDPFAVFTMPRLPHVARLARALEGLLFSLRHRMAVKTVAIMPLSSRNPEVVACATISAVRCQATVADSLHAVKIVAHDGTAAFRRWLDEPALLERAARTSGVPVGGDVSVVLNS
jgi:hypothetical protein